jgi:hypothetical protein
LKWWHRHRPAGTGRPRPTTERRLVVAHSCISSSYPPKAAMRVTADERHVGALHSDKLQALCQSFAERGLFVLQDVIPAAALERLGQRMLSDSAAIVAHGGWGARGEFGQGHLQLGPPRMAPWVHPDIVANPIIEQCVCAILRHDAHLGFLNGNCAMPAAGFQRLHMDDQWDWDSEEDALCAGQTWPHQTTSVHVNFCPTEAVTAGNGGTEVWPRSHTTYTTDELLELGSSHVEAQRAREPPTSNAFPFGAVSFRDARIWHRGVPNRSPRPRPNVVLVYHRQDRQKARTNTPGLLFSESARAAFECRPNPRVNRNVQFVKGPVNHLANSHGPGGAMLGEPDPADLGIRKAKI